MSKTKENVNIERATVDIDGPLRAAEKAKTAASPIPSIKQTIAEMKAAPVVVEPVKVKPEAIEVDDIIRNPEMFPGDYPGLVPAQAKVVYQAKLTEAGYPKTHCPGVVEKRPGVYTLKYGYPEAREFARKRGIR